MFSILLYFLVALLIYTTKLPVITKQINYIHFSTQVTILFLCYYFVIKIIRIKFNNKKYLTVVEYSKLENLFYSLSIIYYFILVYVLGYKEAISRIELVSKFSILESLLSIIPILLFFIIQWIELLKVNNKLYEENYSKTQFITAKLKFIVPAMLPYLFLHFIIDVLEMLGLFSKFNSLPLYVNVLFIAVFFVILSMIFPFFIKYIWGCKPFSNNELKEKIISMGKKEKVKISDVLLWPLHFNKGLSAGIMGPISKFRYMLITPGIMEILNDEEMEAVAYHEIGHVKYNHLLFYILFILGYMVYSNFIMYGVEMILTYLFFNRIIIRNFNSMYLDSFLYFLFFCGFLILYLRYFFGYISRNFERQADSFAVLKQGTAEHISSSLSKLAYYSGDSKTLPSWHHYSVAQRVDFFSNYESDKESVLKRIYNHNRKVKKIKIIYTLILMIGIIGLITIEPLKLTNNFIKKIMTQEKLESLISEYPTDMDYNYLLLDKYYKTGNDKGVEKIYKNIIKYHPNNYRAINNLAWLYLTAENDTIKDIDKGYKLALAAYELKKEDYILDTLAKAYYLKGNYKKALKLEEEAKHLAKKKSIDIKHYMKEIEKYKNVLNSTDND